MRRLWKNIAYRTLFFKKEFLSPFLLNLILLELLTALSIMFCINRIESRAWLVVWLVGIVVAVAISLYYLFHVYVNVVATLDRKLKETQPETVVQSKSSRFTDSIIKILEAYDAVTSREYTNLLLQKQAQFDAMQSQINPHFLYNTLDSIRGKALEEGSVETADMLETLATLFRYSISSSSDMVTISEEISNINSFMRIQNYRFCNRFTLIKNIESLSDNELPLLQYKIPKLTLQPIIENALYHGLDDRDADGTIRIRISKTQTRVEISISDDGVGMDSQTVDRMNQRFLAAEYSTEERSGGGGIALLNVNARIKFSFGDSYGLVAYSTPSIGTEIVVSLPVVGKDND